MTIASGTEVQTASGKTTIVLGPTLTNHGTMRVFGTLRSSSDLTLEGAGLVLLESGGRLEAPSVNLAEGFLGGAGTVAGVLTNAAEVRPGASPGTLRIEGDYHQTSAGRLQIELGGPAAGQFDRLEVTGTAFLDGALAAVRIGGYDPQVYHDFDVLTFIARDGDFSTFENFEMGDRRLLPVYPQSGDLLRLRTVPDVYLAAPGERLPDRVRLYGYAAAGGGALALELPGAAEAWIGLYDALGRRVATVAQGSLPGGIHRFPLASRSLPSGLYFARALLRTGKGQEAHTTRLAIAR